MLALPAPTAEAGETTSPRGVGLSEARLATACVESGETKTHCACMTRYLRRSVHQSELDASVLLQTAAYGGRTQSARQALAKQGVSPSEIQALERQSRKVSTRAEKLCKSLPAAPDVSYAGTPAS